jgi:hypothetical protein
MRPDDRDAAYVCDILKAAQLRRGRDERDYLSNPAGVP